MNRMRWCAVLGLSALWLAACSTRPNVRPRHRQWPRHGSRERIRPRGARGHRRQSHRGDQRRRPLRGTPIDRRGGLVVAPGLIELHTHGEDALNYGYRAMDGVTTMLDTERGTVDVDKWYADRDGKTLVNYGISAGHPAARVQVVGGKYRGLSFLGARAYQRGNARTDRSSRRARPPRARARRARRRLDALLHAGGH